MSFAANPVDPSLRFSIRYVDLPKNAVPVKRRSSERGHAIVAAAIAGAGLSIAIALGIAGAAGAPAIQSPASPVTGEFRLGPGNQAPVGYVAE